LPIASRKGQTKALRDAQAFVDSHQESGGTAEFGITELAASLGITPRAIRFYEDKGLLKPRRINGGRAYARRDKVRLMLILRGKDMGLSLAEIKHVLDLYGDKGEGEIKQLDFILARLDDAMAMLTARRESIELTLTEMKLIRSAFARELASKKAGKGAKAKAA
jgi:DNA-binding transcriptional MerR regulator